VDCPLEWEDAALMKRLLLFGVLALFNFNGTGHSQSEKQNNATESIHCSTQNGWVMNFNGDGSGTVIYGSLPIDQAKVASGVFDLSSIEASITPLLKAMRTSEASVAVHIFKQGQTSSNAEYADDLLPFQQLFREFLKQASFVNPKRFGEMLVEHPPFGLTGLKINDEQAQKPLPMIAPLSVGGSKSPPKLETQNDKRAMDKTGDAALAEATLKSAEERPLAILGSIILLIIVAAILLLRRNRKPQGNKQF
jgi:hypothetical protein